MNSNICDYAGNIFEQYLKNLNINCANFVSNSSYFVISILFFKDDKFFLFQYCLLVSQAIREYMTYDIYKNNKFFLGFEYIAYELLRGYKDF